MKTEIENMLAHTNARLEGWYSSVKHYYGIIGSGIATYDYETQTVSIAYQEDGVKCLWQCYYCFHYKIGDIYDIWMEKASPKIDKI